MRVATTLGSFDIELFDSEIPITVANFLSYMNRGDAADGGYDGSFIHRSARTNLGAPFVIQGGGYYFDSTNGVLDIPKQPAILNEFHRSNLRGTVAMARVGGQVNSARASGSLTSATTRGWTGWTAALPCSAR